MKNNAGITLQDTIAEDSIFVSETSKGNNNKEEFDKVKACSPLLLHSFSLESFEKPKSKEHKLCPNISHNCCNDGAELKSFSIWESNYQEPVEKYYEYMIHAVDFILGWSQESYLLAIDYIQNHPKHYDGRILSEKKSEPARLLNDPLRNTETPQPYTHTDENAVDDQIQHISDNSTDSQEHKQEDIQNNQTLNQETSVIPKPEELTTLTEKINESNEEKCLKAAQILQSIPHDIKIMRSHSQRSLMYYNDLAQIRSGFYCLLCDGDFNSFHSFNWQAQTEKKNLMIGKQFCHQFLDKNLNHIQFMNEDFKNYVNSAITMIECKKKWKGEEAHIESPPVKFDYSPEENLAYQNCRQARLSGQEFLYNCETMCSYFDFTGVNNFIDGNIEQMDNIVNYFNKNKLYFQYPTNNFLVDNPEYTMALLNDNYLKSESRKNFFSSPADLIELDLSHTQVIQSNGPDVYKIIQDNRFPLRIENELIMSLTMIYAVLALIL